MGTDVVEPAHPWECTPPPIPRDTDVSDCLQPLPDWYPRMCRLRRGPLVRWGLEVGQCTLGRCAVHLPAQSTKVDCWTCCLPYQCCRLDTRMQCVPSHGGVNCHLLPEYPVVIQPAIPRVSLCLPNQQPGICQHVTGAWVSGLQGDICKEAVHPRGECRDLTEAGSVQ